MKAGEIAGIDLAGWRIEKTFTPHLKTGLMGFFPVIFPEDRDMPVVTLSHELAEKVVALLPERPHEISEKYMLVKESEAIAFDVFGDSSPWGFEGEYQRLEIKILTVPAFAQRQVDHNTPFKWAAGLVSTS